MNHVGIGFTRVPDTAVTCVISAVGLVVACAIALVAKQLRQRRKLCFPTSCQSIQFGCIGAVGDLKRQLALCELETPLRCHIDALERR